MNPAELRDAWHELAGYLGSPPDRGTVLSTLRARLDSLTNLTNAFASAERKIGDLELRLITLEGALSVIGKAFASPESLIRAAQVVKLDRKSPRAF